MFQKLASFTHSSKQLKFSQPDPIEANWQGNEAPVKQLRAAWDRNSVDEIPMKPAIFGKPGMGKSTLAIHTSINHFNSAIYVQTCSPNTSIEDLFIRDIPRGFSRQNKIASPLLSAFLLGGTCLLEEAFTLSEKNWSLLAPLLEENAYLRSPIDGQIIHPHPDFRFVAIVSEGTIPFDTPDYIYSRLSPRIYLDFPSKDYLKSILANEDNTEESEIVEQLTDYMKKQQPTISVRDGKNILSYSEKLARYEGMDIPTAIRNSAKLISNKKKEIPFSTTLYKINK